MAPTYIVNLTTFVLVMLQFLEIDVAPEQLQTTIATIAIIFAPLFSMFRQWWTGKATWFGGRPVQG